MLFSRYFRARKYHKTFSCNFFGVHVSLVHSLTLLSVIGTHWPRWILSVSFVPGCGRSMDAVLVDVDGLRDE